MLVMLEGELAASSPALFNSGDNVLELILIWTDENEGKEMKKKRLTNIDGRWILVERWGMFSFFFFLR